MEGEEGFQVGLPAGEEVADVEGEDAGAEQEDTDEDIGDRRREITLELTLEDRARASRWR